jgi:hypothetical protein
MNIAVKIKIYKMMTKPAVVCGGETWAVAEMDMKRLGTGEGKILTRMYGLVVQQGIWRIRTNEELWELFEDSDIVADIKRKRMEWLRHLRRMDHGRVVMKVFESKPVGRKRKGRPRMR